MSKKYFWAFQALRAVNESITSLIRQWREYRKRTVDKGLDWSTHITTIPGSRLVDEQCQERVMQVVREIEQRMLDLEEILVMNHKRQDELVASRDGVRFLVLFVPPL